MVGEAATPKKKHFQAKTDYNVNVGQEFALTFQMNLKLTVNHPSICSILTLNQLENMTSNLNVTKFSQIAKD